MDGPWKVAASKITSRVPAWTSASSPPMTPATTKGLLGLAMRSISGVRARCTPSKVTSLSPGRARRMTRVALPEAPSRTRSASKA